MNGRAISIIILLVLFNLDSYAQNHVTIIDSIKRLLPQIQEDDIKAEMYLDLAIYYREISVDSSQVYFNLVQDLIDTAATSPLRTKYYYWLGEHYYITGESDRSWKALAKAAEGVEENTGTINLGVIQNKMAGVKIRMGKNDEATPLLMSAIEKLTATENVSVLANAYNSLGTVMERSNRPKEAQEYYQKAYDYAIRTDEQRLANGILSNQAMMYSLQGDHRKALPLYHKIIDFGKENGELRTMALGYTNAAVVYTSLNLLDSAEISALKAVEIFGKLNNPRGIAAAASQLSGIYIAQGRNREAVNLLLPQYEIVKKNRFKNFEIKIVKNLENAFVNLNDYEQAYRFSTLHAELKDANLNETIANTVNDAEVRYQSLEKEAEIEQLALEGALNKSRISQQRMALVGTFIGLSLLSFFLYRIFSQKRKIENQKTIIEKALGEKETLLKEIHHRVKNNLQVISSLLKLQSHSISDANTLKVLDEGQNRVRSMSLIHQNLYMEGNLTGIDMPTYLDQMSNELISNYSLNGKTVERNLEIENIRLDVDTVVPMGLIINELITNSLKYAFQNTEHPMLSIELSKKEEGLYLKIADNGIGFDPDEKSNDQIGMKLVQSFAKRLKADYTLNTTLGTSATFIIKDYKLMS